MEKADSSFVFDIQALFVYEGVPILSNTEVVNDCEEGAVGTNPCKLYSLTTGKKHCIECSQKDPSVKWLLGQYSSDYFRCDNDATAHQSFAKRDSLHHDHMYDKCGLSKYPSGTPSTCTACSDANCLACDSSNCLGCSFEDGKFLHSGSCSQSTNGDCAPDRSGQFYSPGSCLSCSSFCVNCVVSTTVCPTFSVTGAQVFVYDSGSNPGVMCDFNTHGTESPRPTGTPTCTACGSACSGCTKVGGGSKCLDCPFGRVYNVQSGACINVCDGHDKNFYDPVTSSCKSCSTGCKRCLDASFCSECDTANNYVLVGHQCQLCSPTPANVNYLNQQTSPPSCIKHCDASHCTSCSGTPPTCSACDKANGYYLEGGFCPRCAVNNGWFIPPSGDSCNACSTNCLECTDASTCTKCDPNSPVKLYLKDGACVETCPTSAGYYISANQLLCEKCLTGCQVCPDGSTCTTCLPTHIKSADSSKCDLCDTSESKKIFYSSTTPPSCKDCQEPCLTCETSPTNCKSCPANYELVQDPQTNQGTCKETQNNPNGAEGGQGTSTCHQTCKTCQAPTERECLSCEETKCLTIKGTCEACPGTVPPVVNPDPILQDATLTWGVKQIDPNEKTRYKVKFSEEEIYFNPKFDLFDLKKQITVNLIQQRN